MDLIDNLGAEAGQAGSRGSGGAGVAGAVGDSVGAMVISFAHHARVVQPFTGDLNLLRHAVHSVEPTDQSSRLEMALQLIEPFSAGGSLGQAHGSDGSSPHNLVVYVLSDGRVQNATRPLALRGGGPAVREDRPTGDG